MQPKKRSISPEEVLNAPPVQTSERARDMALQMQPLDITGEISPPPPTPQPVQQPAPAPKQQEQVRQPEQPEESGLDWMEMLMVGATPLLSGMIAGDAGTGAEVAGAGLLDVNKNIIEQNKLKAKSLRDKSSRQLASDKGRYQARTVEKDGKTYLVTYDTATGEFLSPEDEVLAGYKQTVRTDPTTDELIKVTGAGNIEEMRGARPSPLTVKQKQEVGDLTNRMLRDPKFRDARKTVSSTQRALALLDAGNPVADEGIKTIFPRMFGEVGNLAVQEQERFSGSPELRRKFDRLFTKYERGTLTNEDRADLMEVAQVMQEFDRQNLYQAFNSFSTSAERRLGYDPRPYLRPFVEESTPSVKGTVRRARRKAPTRGKPKRVIQNGVTFELQANGEYEAVDE